LICPDPGTEEVEFLAFMDRLGKSLDRRGVLFLTRDQDISAVSRNQDQLQHLFRLPFARWEVLGRILDKEGQYTVAQQADVPLPTTFFPRDEADVDAYVKQVPYPCILKPAYHVNFWDQFGVKGFVAHNPEEATARIRLGMAHGYRMVIQEIIPGSEDRLYTLGSYLNREGTPLAIFTGRKLRQSPRDFGTCRVGESCSAPRIVELGLRLLRALGFWGISQVEFKLDPRDQQFKLIEVNARSYQWQHLGSVCGANLAYTAYRDSLGETVLPVVASDLGKRWMLAFRDLQMAPSEIARGQISVGEWLAGWPKTAVDGIFSLRDPKPGLHYLRALVCKSGKRRLRRFLFSSTTKP
jgi:predicted ATP-grasp superfamily ATP-dependent carboligase